MNPQKTSLRKAVFQGDAGGYRTYSPTSRSKTGSLDWKALYGLYCIKIWNEDKAVFERTGEILPDRYPTEERFREMLLEARRPHMTARRTALVDPSSLYKLAQVLLANPSTGKLLRHTDKRNACRTKDKGRPKKAP